MEWTMEKINKHVLQSGFYFSIVGGWLLEGTEGVWSLIGFILWVILISIVTNFVIETLWSVNKATEKIVTVINSKTSTEE